MDKNLQPPEFTQDRYMDQGCELELVMPSLAREVPDERLKPYLCGPREIARRVSSGEDAIELSLEKWRRILDFLNARDPETMFTRTNVNPTRYFLADTCALCLVSTEIMQRVRGVQTDLGRRKCEACPLARVDGCREPGSIYNRLMDASFADREKMGALLREMIQALESTRDRFGADFAREASESRRLNNIVKQALGVPATKSWRGFLNFLKKIRDFRL